MASTFLLSACGAKKETFFGGEHLDMELFADMQQSAQNGNAEAHFQLGLMYDKGMYGVRRSSKKARAYYEQAAAQEHAKALNNLGVIYHDGKGVKRDYQKAWEYFMRATNKGSPEGKKNLEILKANREMYEWINSQVNQGRFVY